MRCSTSKWSTAAFYKKRPKLCMQTEKPRQQQQLLHYGIFSLRCPKCRLKAERLKHVLLRELPWNALVASGQVKNLLYCSRTHIFTVTQVICAVARKQPSASSRAVSFCKSRYVHPPVGASSNRLSLTTATFNLSPQFFSGFSVTGVKKKKR